MIQQEPNIANEQSQVPIGIDFSRIGIIASSFADEVFWDF